MLQSRSRELPRRTAVREIPVLALDQEYPRTLDSEDTLSCVNCGQAHTAKCRGYPKTSKVVPHPIKRTDPKNDPSYLIANRNFPALAVKNPTQVSDGDRSAAVPTSNPWFGNEPPMATSEPPKETTRQESPSIQATSSEAT
ncbi:hypothetical protein EVAR_52322_1 [Eumeta japonica]|uniref:Nucleic-acid-binding protein from transposon X-element n=1 Tax=Eumeta variegata TaxID=151549 RepID=A0A4C1Y4L3_EUMVA|nr:hypothetical protein EVAR_52322_1 [Eumeta japonica]